MRVLQFAFGSADPENPFKPHNYVRRTVVYTGTHDNDTTLGWFRDVDPGARTGAAERAREERRRALAYVASDGREPHWDFIRTALSSVADAAIVPLQDVLGLDSGARMNLPARPEGNWEWRVREDELGPEPGLRLRELTEMYGRLPTARTETGSSSMSPECPGTGRDRV
jgi:4-alpha-glucanotransferase